MGDQLCAGNQWNGTFTEYGAYAHPTLADITNSQFGVPSDSPPDMPVPLTPSVGWFFPSNCFAEPGHPEERSIGTEKDDLPQGRAFAIYPNPATNHLNVVLPDRNEISRIELHDLAGKLILSMPVPGGTDIYHINLPPIVPGLYLVKISSQDYNYTTKLVVAK